jgi:uncharacterized membrane protein
MSPAEQPQPAQAGEPAQVEAPAGVRAEDHVETRLNMVISRVLSVGLLAAVGLLLVGAVLAVARPGVPVSRATSITDMGAQLWALEAGGFFQLGLVVLLLTPFARVIALCIAFVRMRQWLFVAISVVVAMLLILGAVLGFSLG